MILFFGVLLVGVGGANQVDLLNSDQSFNQTFITIQECADVVSPGQTCLVYPGNYSERVRINKDGTASGRLTFQAYPSKSVLMQGFTVRGEYVTIEGFNITNRLIGTDELVGILIYEGSYLEIVDNYLYDLMAPAIRGMRHNVYDIYIGYNKIYKCRYGINFAHINNFNTIIEHNEITRLYSWDVHGDCDFIRIGGEGFIIRNNYMGEIKFQEITYIVRDANGEPTDCNNDSDCEGNHWCAWDNRCRYNAHVDNIEIVSYRSPSSERYVMHGIVENNILMDSGQSIKAGTAQHDSEKLSANITLRNNIIAYVSSNAIGVAGIDDFKVYNNLFYRIGRFISYSDSTIPQITNGSVIAKNNIIYQTNGLFALSEGANISEMNNLVYKGPSLSSIYSICIGEGCKRGTEDEFELNEKTLELYYMDPFLKNMPISPNLKEITSPNHFVTSSSFNDNISVGDFLVYKNDRVKREITNKQLNEDDLILTVDIPLENDEWEVIQWQMNTSRGIGYFEIWPAGSNTTYDFSLLADSPAIDNGVDLSEEGFNTDFDGNLRESGAWDIGAYEYIPLETCTPHSADLNSDCSINRTEITTYINSWKQNTEISLTDVMDAIGKWKAGSYS